MKNMSAKLIYSLTDENPDMQKQIGCMNGFFHLFDRHRYLASHSHKRLPQPGKNGDQPTEANKNLAKATEKNSKKVVKEKRKPSAELPRHSVSSSSCSSSLSSLDYNRAAHLEPSASRQNVSSEAPSQDLPVNQPNGSTKISRKSSDLRDVVKDSMHREARGLAVKTAAKEEAGFRTLRYIDSPRPLEPPSSAKPRISGLNDSFRVLSKFREGKMNSNEEKDGRNHSAPKDQRRFSYDGRESQDALKSTIKLKELPRLSLDSRQGCIRGGSTSEAKSSNLLNDLQMQQEPGSSKRASSVVAKLMGLVDPMPITDDPVRPQSTFETEKLDPLSRSLRTTKVNKQDHFSGSPRNSHKEIPSPRVKKADLVIKTTPNQKFPIETAPWKQPHGKRAPQSLSFKCHETSTKPPPTSTLTVYGEIEKKLADLEFKKSGKDLRALKQILEAMQKTKDILDTKKDQKFAYQAADNSSLAHGSNLGNQRNLHSSISDPPTANGAKAPKGYNSPIIIMKPATLVGKDTDPASTTSRIDNLLDLRKHQISAADNRKVTVEKRTVKHLTTRSTQVTNSFNRQYSSQDRYSNIRNARSAQASKMPQGDSDENSGHSSRSSGTMSPRLQQRRSGLEKQSTPAGSSDSSRSRRHGSMQPTESSSPGRKCRPKSSNVQRTTDYSSDTRTSSRDICHQDNSVSLQSESNISMASDTDNEVSSCIQLDHINSIYTDQNSQKQKNSTAGFRAIRKMAEPGRATPEQPSPVSVLDATFYRDDSPSPVKKTSNAFKDDETRYLYEEEWELMDLDQPSNGRKSNLSTEVDHKILENIKHWLQNPQEMNSSDVEHIIADTAFLCDSKDPDHKYIADIVFASNLHKKLESGWMNIQFRKSGHLIDPKLFSALEKTKAITQFLSDEHGSEKSLQLISDEKIHRKLIFDVVNEILVRKLVVTDSFTEWLVPEKPTGNKLRGQKLLRELCSEVDRLQGKNSSGSLNEEDSLESVICEDMTQWPMNWTEYAREIPAMVLDVERLIFKDLITEVASGEAALLQGRPSVRRCRQLFPEQAFGFEEK